MPKPFGVAPGSLLRLHSDVGPVRRDTKHPALHRLPGLHNILAQVSGKRLVAPFVAAAVRGPVVDHVDGLGGIHAAVPAAGPGVLYLNRQNVIGLEGEDAYIFVVLRRADDQQSLHGNVQGRRREDQQQYPGYGDDGFQFTHRHLPEK